MSQFITYHVEQVHGRDVATDGEGQTVASEDTPVEDGHDEAAVLLGEDVGQDAGGERVAGRLAGSQHHPHEDQRPVRLGRARADHGADSNWE